MITEELLKLLFDYRDGQLYWKVSNSNIVKVGSLAGYNRPPQNYRYVGIEKKYYLVHRLIYLYHHGELPKYIDHMDGDVYNNRIENLRECTQSQNLSNVTKSSRNTSGYKGVCWQKSNNKWRAKVVKNSQAYIKFFHTKEEANIWAMKMREMLHGEFYKH